MENSLSQAEQQQYSRHLLMDAIGIKGQLALKNAKVLVLGAGGLGCPVLQYLAAAGVGTLGILDDDTVDQTNLQRQVLYTHEDIGKPKALVAKTKLQGLNPFISLNAIQERLTIKNALELFKVYDIIIDCTDNFPTRYLANDAAIISNKPLVYGAIFKFEGQVSVFNYEDGPSYRCIFPDPPAAGSVPNCSEIGVLGVLPGIIGSFQANEAIKMICGIGETLSGKLLTFDALTMQSQAFSFSKTVEANIVSFQEDYEVFCGLPKAVEELSFDGLEQLNQPYSLLDVRTYEEREIHHIGGIHIPLDEITARANQLPKNETLVVYCKSGMRSLKAIGLLQDLGAKNTLINLKNGLPINL